MKTRLECCGYLNSCPLETQAWLSEPRISVKIPEQQILNDFVLWMTLEFFKKTFSVSNILKEVSDM